MPANVETMFSAREVPWHGLGKIVEGALSSREAIKAAGLDWDVYQSPVMLPNGRALPHYLANMRSSDDNFLGIVSDMYSIVQNSEAFEFTDYLLGEGVKYETAGSLQDGRRVWLLAKIPDQYKILDEEITPYLVFSNSHDGSSSLKVAMTPVRVVCQNTLNYALETSKRYWAIEHIGEIRWKMEEARESLGLARKYMDGLRIDAEALALTKMTESQVKNAIDFLLPIPKKATESEANRVNAHRNELFYRFMKAPDLADMELSAYRFVNAVSDYATHSWAGKDLVAHKEHLFAETIDGISLINKARRIMLSLK